MKFLLFSEGKAKQVSELFNRVFTASEGVAEGQVIANFVDQLMATTKPEELIGCLAEQNDLVVGSIFFSRFIVPNENVAFILSPVAVATDVQGKGIGQQLIQYGLDHLKSLGVNLVFTYGDPEFYSKVGFEQIEENTVRAPFPLSQPIGWLAQSLDGQQITAMSGPTQCVKALSDPNLW